MREGPQPRPPRREVHRAEALAWLARNASNDSMGVVTSLPDFSELHELDFEAWRSWFVSAGQAVLEWVSPSSVAIFFQTDVRRRGVWIEKSHLVLRAAEAADARLLWHKIICRKPPGTVTHGRAGYSHLLCFARAPRPPRRSASPDVLAEAGYKPTEKSMGVLACRLACQFLLDETSARTVVDPFCGSGTALAVANAMGLDALGVDRSGRCCSAARRLDVTRQLPAQ